ncbi:peptidoglycan recognition protein family protein [Mycolicibacterium fluoranthenivorans]|uniref:N-acetylmuramoyl-L-alanine amidase n=1 Tax=Mycolicibacterium fluoranthenivorans TaxID=258505 RepID=A0A7X5U5H0_9MYCO|nr:peptidoglycan-binding domain-containing protein [Mycolicibacterium fluoranthenivorans]MCV7354672.1 N-acetylmuramoyl-L-alanine amidase [Mycolicibacterium fluoranthenivorans]NIH98738.1 N-acetyl-anhydromuramyl-L-alanine amidase AmpD [Mycolicibacterium fluoranthenivorans]
MPSTRPWTGDPVWLADVLRAEGLDVVEYPGWRDRGHGDFQDIRGVMVHHTGSDTATAASIAEGRPDLAGPLSQLHIARDGTVTVVALGVAWHAGVGMYPWVPANMGNWHLIGIECANTGTSPLAPHRQNWPDAQYFALVRCCAAINRRLAQTSARTIGHKEYAGYAQGKWDPGAIGMTLLRSDIAVRIGVIADPAPTPRPPVPVGEYTGILLYRGVQGPQVSELQRRLKYAYASYAGGLVVDGDYGPQTEAAVREFQRRTAGLVVDGVVGPATAAALQLKVIPAD